MRLGKGQTCDTVSTYTVGGTLLSVNGANKQHGSLERVGDYAAWT